MSSSSCDLTFIGWDTESNMLDHIKGVIIQIALVATKYDRKQQKFVEIDSFMSYISTDESLGDSYKIHGIRAHDLVGAPDFPQCITLMINFCKQFARGGTVWMAHHGAGFDEPILYNNFHRHSLDFNNFIRAAGCRGWIDTLSIAKKCIPDHECPKTETGRPLRKLGALYNKFVCKKLEGAHDALNDTRGIFEWLNSAYMQPKIKFEDILNRRKWLRTNDMMRHAIKKKTTVDRNKRAIKFKSVLEVTNTPKFMPLTQKDSELIQQNVRICVNCVSLVMPTDPHTTCTIPAGAWTPT